MEGIHLRDGNAVPNDHAHIGMCRAMLGASLVCFREFSLGDVQFLFDSGESLEGGFIRRDCFRLRFLGDKFSCPKRYQRKRYYGIGIVLVRKEMAPRS